MEAEASVEDVEDFPVEVVEEEEDVEDLIRVHQKELLKLERCKIYYEIIDAAISELYERAKMIPIIKFIHYFT